ncbi:hypothetical protein C8Q73DRAFT_751321 [Cubamyces lactineus]|nr:hypothetical protein C8Q73DRAFT_751321 [Cubamyces lactineus]
MAVVIASSHSPVMSSSEQPRTPSPAPKQGETVVSADGASEIATSSVAATDPNVVTSKRNSDPGFFDTHLRACPAEALKKIQRKKLITRLVSDIGKANEEVDMYAPLTSLLSEISKTVFTTCISSNKSKKSRPRFQNEREIEFLNHSSCPLAQFPVGEPDVKPDVVGVFKLPPNQHFVIHHDGTYREIPCHRVETFVEAKTERDRAKGLPQAGSYIYHMLQCRPDRPGYYGLTVTPKYFKVLYGCPTGLVSSELTPWTEVEKLCAYVYSLYDPPTGHILHDRTVTWQEPKATLFGRPSWTITTKRPSGVDSSSEDSEAGEDDVYVYRGAELIFLGYPFGRRTTIFRVRREGYPPVIIKEYFVGSGRRFEESDLLSHIHAQGFVPGVVRAATAETVVSEGEAIIFHNASTSETRTKRRIVLVDAGVDLEYAKSVNDLLKVAYDALEIHRSVARHRRVLHRDMSLFNILMYPTSCECDEGDWCDFLPPLIDEVLTGQRLPNDKRNPHSLVIDFDHSAKLDVTENTVEVFEELQFRTGTPMYIARAVVVTAELPSSAFATQFEQMPVLSAKARALYVKAHGEERYIKYCDDPDGDTYHGGTRPPVNDVDDLIELASRTVFYHRWRYDAESVFWTLYSVLLRVLPVGAVDTAKTASMLKKNWTDFKSHTIPDADDTDGYNDNRIKLFANGRQAFKSAFLPKMQDVAELLYEMGKHVLPSYALMSRPPPHDDHLHEALQRLILEYLVTHEGDPIPLTPGVLRAAAAKAVKQDGLEVGTYGDKSKTGTQGNGKKRTRDEAQGPQRQSSRKSGGTELTRPREDDPPTLRGLLPGNALGGGNA